MIILAKIVYWLMSILAALLLASPALLLVDIYAYGQEIPDWWVHVLSLVLLAICVWFVGWAFRYFVRRIWGSTTANPATPEPKTGH